MVVLVTCISTIDFYQMETNEACIGYFGIRDICLFFKGYWDICVFYFGIWDIQEFWDMGYWNLFWDTS